LTLESLREGVRVLASRDADLAQIVRRLGDPPIWGRRPGFSTLVRIILEQQVSLDSALAMYRRLDQHVGGTTPDAVCGLEVDGLRQLGFTRQKAAYCHGLAMRVRDGSLNLGAVARASDAEGRAWLLAVPGLGPWSVDIYYLMALRRPDVWPHGDLALAASLRDVKRLGTRPDRRDQEALSDRWRPWRSVAARILWLHYLAARGRVAGVDPR
jgi:DNA-3-methyladenine glycosylase II